MAQKRSAGFSITLGSDVIGCLTGWEIATEVSEEEVSCLGDTVGDPPIIEENYLPTTVGHTGSVEGVSVFNDAGQSAVENAADTGAIVTIEARYYDGSGYDLTGFFTSYSVTGSKDQFAETFSGELRITQKTIVNSPS